MLIAQARYQTTPTAAPSGRPVDLLCDPSGRLVVTQDAAAGPLRVEGVVADGAAVGTTKPVVVGGVDAAGNAQWLRVGADGKLSIQLETDADIALTVNDEITVSGKDAAGTPRALLTATDGVLQASIRAATVATYRVSLDALAGPAGIAATLFGSATKTVKVTRVVVSKPSTQVRVKLQRTAAATTGGTPAAGTVTTKLDANNATATATATRYTAAAAAGDTPQNLANLVLSTADTLDEPGEGAAGPRQPIVLRGATQGLLVDLGGAATLDGYVEWTEE